MEDLEEDTLDPMQNQTCVAPSNREKNSFETSNGPNIRYGPSSPRNRPMRETLEMPTVGPPIIKKPVRVFSVQMDSAPPEKIGPSGKSNSVFSTGLDRTPLGPLSDNNQKKSTDSHLQPMESHSAPASLDMVNSSTVITAKQNSRRTGIENSKKNDRGKPYERG